MLSVAQRFALRDHIQGLWYPQHGGVWLKVVPSRPLAERAEVAGEVATAREVLETFLASELYNWLPEDSAYGTFTDCAWRPIDRAEALRCVDEIVAGANARVAEARAEEADLRAEAEAGGYLHALGPSPLESDMCNFELLRQWFVEELWGATEPAWFTNMGPDFDEESAIVGLDGDVLALLWLCRRRPRR